MEPRTKVYTPRPAFGAWKREQRLRPQQETYSAPGQPYAPSAYSAREHTVRDILAIGFRQKRKILTTFFFVFGLGALVVAGLPREFESEMKILVRRGRAEEVVTAQLEQARGLAPGVNRQEINTEAHILASRELALKVIGRSPTVRESIAHPPEKGLKSRLKSTVASLKSWAGFGSAESEPEADEALADKFLERLTITPLGESNVIRVAFLSQAPEVATAALDLLSQAYLDKHLAVHRTTGSEEVFAREANRHAVELAGLREQIADLTARKSVNVQLEKDALVQKILDLEGELQQTGASIAGLERRLENLQQESERTPERRTTAVRTSPMLLESLREELNRLELQRIELERKFLPDYGPVVQVKQQIEATQAAIRQAQQAPPLEEITDRDPTFDWVSGELARTRADLAAARAMRVQLAQAITRLRGRSVDLDTLDRVRERLERDATLAEQGFMAYKQRADEARISEQLDRERVLNVAIAETPTKPIEPVGHSRSLMALAILALSGLAALGIGVVADFFDPTFRRPEELEEMLGVPVLASVPKS